ncbi:MAG: helix-turn-helix domain-containing protein [Bacillus sp. (in: Bacteria)]|nr:helix-turn-helix domain-containing protein [Bacillus sp. (in: firmicutes)]
MKPTKEARDIINELASKQVDLSDPKTIHLIQRLHAIAAVHSEPISPNELTQYYSVKEVAELFDVTIQSVYKWINEEKIEYKLDDGPGKQQRKGYLIPKDQFNDHGKINDVDESFFKRRLEEMEEIPRQKIESTDLPTNSNRRLSKHGIRDLYNRNTE